MNTSSVTVLPVLVARDAAEGDPLGPWRILFYFSTILPWTIVQFYDAIGRGHKKIRNILYRLFLSTMLNSLATGAALFYLVYSLGAFGARGQDFTEAGTMLVALIINSWFWLRNIKGYSQRWKLQQLRGAYLRFMMKATSADGEYETLADYELLDPCWRCITPGDVYYMTHHWDAVEVNHFVIDNDIHAAVPRLRFGSDWKGHRATSRAFWLTIWEQARRGYVLPRVPVTSVTKSEKRLARDFGTAEPNCSKRYYAKYNQEARSAGKKVLEFENSTTRKEGLAIYPDGEDDEHSGQQDVHSVAYQYLYSFEPGDQGLRTVLAYIAKTIPHRLTNAWYFTDTWDDMTNTTPATKDLGDSWIPLPPDRSVWNEIAYHVSRENVNAAGLGAMESVRYTGRILAASNIIAYHHRTYMRIVEDVLHCGKTARWTYGWSGRLSCYSAYFTREHVYLALLDGITLLAIRKNKYNHPRVVELLTAFASFTIMEERCSFNVLKARQDELVYRYTKNKGKTCRGSGLSAIRETCALLDIPATCSKLDGHPAFLMGWAYEYRVGQPGNQAPEHGEDHDEIERIYGSTTAIRFPNAII